MSIAILVTFYAAAFWLIRLGAQQDMSDGARLAFNILGGIGALFLPLFLFGALNFWLKLRVAKRVARAWCEEQKGELLNVEIHKNHYSARYRLDDRKLYQKFRIRFVSTTWWVKQVFWLRS